ncbi:class I SAM-dependent DNA methyltransferase (plasmid) [Psychrobacter sp. Sarcosine-02u-2]|uniref:DNA methyltransferase n=2 Tax=unclassified Psychrobacter TaxID=196806 RepID=UPI000C7B4541|nr:DNA methyltransferase [Psychrobacter sp. Sarcosine-02u-2]PKG85501.1 class I SAM-dependent DNA methyltransferase [Psychrobacter sp. Sarcosine-02u-2]
MSLDYQHIREQLHRIIHDYKDAEGYERGQSQNFWTQIFNAYGVSGQVQLKAFEHRLKDDKSQKYVDAFIPKLVMIEQKSRGLDLNKAYNQVSKYYERLSVADKPRYIVLSNFDELWLFDIENPLNIKEYKCRLADLPKNAEWLDFLAPNAAMAEIVEENPINRQATEMVAKLHQAFISDGVNADELALFLTRLIFCFFADDTGIFGQKNLLDGLLTNEARSDGSNLNEVFTTLFDTLNTKDRSSRLPESYAAFAYINGDLFSQSIRIPYFDENLYNLVVQCNNLDWSEISPAIFGSMFQSVLDIDDTADSDDKRREFGAHYTSEKNILKVINSLFLQELRDEFSKCAKDKPRAIKLYEKLPTLKFFDPACGCGNFLIIAYRELRLLENQLIAQIYGDQRGLLDISSMCQVTVEQFYGIEIEPHAAHIARVAMWITDHQLNQATAERFGTTRPTTPIVYSPHITEGNALQIDWEDVLTANECDFVMGNPPFIGYAYQNKEQKADMAHVAINIKKYKSLDYVSGWYVKAMHYMQSVTKQGHHIETAFVSTNSIVQGEHVANLWQYLLEKCCGHINFAHHTFKWTNEGKGVAGVHCVIVGYSTHERKDKAIFSYDDISGDPTPNKAKIINGYLIDGALVFFDRAKKQVSNELEMSRGNQPTDGGNLLLSDDEYKELIGLEPIAEKYIKRYMMGYEFLNDVKRWCLWFDGCDPLQLNKDLREMPLVQSRIENVKSSRLSSTKLATIKKAETPHLFDERRHTNSPYIGLPTVSSENRRYIPIGFLDKDIIAGNKIYIITNATTYHFGILSSGMHNAFMRLTAGRLESRYNYSNTIVYNNFPYPFDAKAKDNKTVKAKDAIGLAAQAVLDARKHYQDDSEDAPTLAKLYNTYMIDPYPELTKAHIALDRAVDKAYGYKGKGDDASRVEFLLKRIANM